MNNYEQELRDKWSQITYYQGGTIQLSGSHPLEWYVGYFSPNMKSIVVVSDTPISKIDSSNSIQVSCNLRQDGRYAISFTLLSGEQEDVFVTMCGDMIRYSSSEKSGKQALVRLLRRYNAWLRLLRQKSSPLLSAGAQKGLIGELLYLKEQLEKDLLPESVVAGWVGPDGADQDFVYPDGWHEIKTIGISSSEVVISSVEQLSCQQPGELIIMRVDKCAPAQINAFTLYGLVHQILNLLTSKGEGQDEFLLKLSSIGYIDIIEYNQQSFIFSSKQIYKVDGLFPRIMRKDIPKEIVNLSYVISVPGLAYWLK